MVVPVNKENEAKGTVVRENVQFDREFFFPFLAFYPSSQIIQSMNKNANASPFSRIRSRHPPRLRAASLTIFTPFQSLLPVWYPSHNQISVIQSTSASKVSRQKGNPVASPPLPNTPKLLLPPPGKTSLLCIPPKAPSYIRSKIHPSTKHTRSPLRKAAVSGLLSVSDCIGVGRQEPIALKSNFIPMIRASFPRLKSTCIYTPSLLPFLPFPRMSTSQKKQLPKFHSMSPTGPMLLLINLLLSSPPAAPSPSHPAPSAPHRPARHHESLNSNLAAR